jgi:kynureninase
VRIGVPAFLFVKQRKKPQQFTAVLTAYMNYTKRSKINEITSPFYGALQYVNRQLTATSLVYIWLSFFKIGQIQNNI